MTITHPRVKQDQLKGGKRQIQRKTELRERKEKRESRLWTSPFRGIHPSPSRTCLPKEVPYLSLNQIRVLNGDDTCKYIGNQPMNLAMKINDSFNGNATSNRLINENLFSISCFRATKRLLKVSEWWSDKRFEKGTVHAKHPST